MTVFGRKGHWKTNANGTTYWVRSHRVHRNHWDANALRDLSADSLVYRATDLLRRSNVGKGKQGCFVNPNARCPECGAPVFFYANTFGSRVFFDDLGPPWPKHPCTDHPRVTADPISLIPPKIQVRGKGVIYDLITAANQTGFFRNKKLGVRSGSEWTLCVVEQLSRTGRLTSSKARIIDAENPSYIDFSFFSQDPLITVGDLVSMNGSEFSFFCPQVMAEVRFKDGKDVRVETCQTASAEIECSSASKAQKVSEPFDHAIFGMSGWDRSELRHFWTKLYPFDQFVARYRKILKSGIENGARTPEDFSKYLANLHYRTGVGAQWTPRLVGFLVHFAISGGRPPEMVVHSSALNPDMTEAEMHHFHSTSLSLDKLLKRAERIIRPVIAKGGKNPSTVAKHLNKVNFRTASGARWSPRLSKFLIDLIFAHRVPTPSKIDQVGPPSGNATRVTSDEIGQPLSTTSFNREQIAEKLASLGRVVVVGKGE